MSDLTDDETATSWATLLAEQLSWHWGHQARARLDGLTDEEYRWEPVHGMWSIRPRGDGVAMEVGVGDAVIDFAIPPPRPEPVTSIAWRLAHLVVGVFGDRNARHFGGPPIAYDSYDYPLSAGSALTDLDEGYQHWISSVRALSDAALLAPSGEPGFEQLPLASLVLHIHREAIHHLAEVALLRDLYLRRDELGADGPADAPPVS